MPISVLSCTYGKYVIPQRYVLCCFTFFGVLLSYSLRISLNLVITQMVVPIQDFGNDVCVRDEKEMRSAPRKDPQHWTEKQQGLILGSFFVGYVITHLPGGVMADEFGGKHVLSGGVFIASLLTLVTPLAVNYGSWWCLMILRSIIGLCQGPMFPSVTTLLAKWVPLRERGCLGALTMTGAQIGTITGNFISSVLLGYTNDWAVVFYFWGFLGLVWYALFILFVYSEPAQHPFITLKEATMLEEEIGATDRMKIPWKRIFLDKAVIALIIGLIGHDWIFFLIVTNLPKYMSDVLKFTISEIGIITSLPFIGLWIVSTISGALSDLLIRKQLITVINARRMLTCIGHFIPATCLVLASYMGCDRTSAGTMFILSIIGLGTFYPGMRINVLDISKNFAGIVMAICNGLSAVCFIPVAPLIGIFTKDHTVEQWRWIFWVISFGVIVTTVIYCLLASGERAEWDKAHHEL